MVWFCREYVAVTTFWPAVVTSWSLHRLFTNLMVKTRLQFIVLIFVFVNGLHKTRDNTHACTY